MGSETDVSEISALFERLVRNRDMSLFLPFIFGLSESNSRGESTTEEEGQEEDQDGETEGGRRRRRSTEAPNRERIILVNPFTQGMVVIDGASSLEALLREIGNNNNNNSFGKGGLPPASKESIEAMPRVEVKEGEEEEEEGVGECVVCLEEFSVGVVVKEMPCRHRFHPDCIEKWLGIHGSCPVCRYEMPVEERDEGKKRDEEGGEERRVDGGGGGGSGNGEVWVSFSTNRDSRRSQEDQNQAPAAGDDSSDSTSSPSGDAEIES